MEVFWDIVHTFDYEILLQLFQHWRGGVSDTVWTVFSTLGNGGALWIALAVILLFFRKTRRAGAAMLAALLIGLLVGNVFLKEWVMRPRPFVTHPELTALLDPGDQWSFPSGHTLSSFAAATALCFFHRKAGAVAYAVAALIGFSRLYACVHYPTDVLAGLLIGILCGLLAAWLVDRLFDRIHAVRLRKGVQ
ncbi:phosphatase PAP2 family protein [Agathobaculum sp. TL06]